MNKIKSEEITAKEINIGDLLGSNNLFKIPNYQRPYSWTEEATQLVEDVENHIEENRGEKRKETQYFSGSIITCPNKDGSQDIIDGQQRLITICITLSILRHLISDESTKNQIHEMLIQKELPLNNISETPRVEINAGNHFFLKYVMDKDEMKIVKLYDLIDYKKNDGNYGEINVVENTQNIYKILKDKSPKELIQFSKCLLNQLVIVKVDTSDIEQAFKIFSIINTRGLDLTLSDILKARLSGQIKDKNKQDSYIKKWVKLEEDIGRDDFNNVFTHIAMIIRKDKAKVSTLEYYEGDILPKDEYKAEVFMNDWLEECVKNYHHIANYGIPIINKYTYWLWFVGNNDWVPPALFFLKQHSQEKDSNKIQEFFKQLERLGSIMMILRKNVNDRIKVYGDIMKGIEQDKPEDYNPANHITEDHKKDTLARLDEDNIYTDWKQFRMQLVRRLDSSMSGYEDIPPTTDKKKLTMEHVLPQNPDPGSEWNSWYDESQRNEWVHRLGNLVLLTKQKNSAMQNYNFKDKKEKYYKGREHTPLSITIEAWKKNDWKPETLEKMHKQAVEFFEKEWELTPKK